MKRLSSGGFTIVESMIVLGVTGVLFVSLAGMVGGQQARARFKSSMTDISTQIQSQINEVSTGFYPNTQNFRCTGASGSLSVTVGANEQGTNSGCTFLGRAMMFGIPDTDPEEYKIHTLIGLRRTALNKEPTTLREASTRVLAPGTTPTYNSNWQDLSTTKYLQFGTTLSWMRSTNGSPTRIAGIAIVSAPNQQVAYGQNGAIEAGTVIPSVIPIPYAGAGSDPGATSREGVNLIIRSLGLPMPGHPSAIAAEPTDGPVQLCFRSGGTDQSGLVTIGSNNSTTSVEFEILNTTDCS